ncbi:hypothetical protein ACSQ67_014445 [Phaseolus vulgaris]
MLTSKLWREIDERRTKKRESAAARTCGAGLAAIVNARLFRYRRDRENAKREGPASGSKCCLAPNRVPHFLVKLPIIYPLRERRVSCIGKLSFGIFMLLAINRRY